MGPRGRSRTAGLCPGASEARLWCSGQGCGPHSTARAPAACQSLEEQGHGWDQSAEAGTMVSESKVTLGWGLWVGMEVTVLWAKFSSEARKPRLVT